MKVVMHCETCGKVIFYDDEWEDFACPYCGEEYEAWTEEDTEMFLKGIVFFLKTLPFVLLNKSRRSSRSETDE